MCGIVALWDPSLDAASRLLTAEGLAERLNHRGPDGRGAWSDPLVPIALAHRRLAIQGLGQQGAQPMQTRDGASVVIYNGELFDAGDLRRELVGSGIVFRGNSDTEILLHALARWGMRDALEKIQGQFAFAWYEARSRRLYLARDRVGIRPFYYAHVGSRFAAASEQKALLGLDWVDRAPSPEALLRYLLLGRTDDVPGETMLQRVHSLPAGHWAEWDGERLSLHRYHRVDVAPEEATVVEVRRQLERAVDGQLVGEVPIGVMVSGGTDSSTVALLADHFRVTTGATETLHLFAYHDSFAHEDERPYQQAVMNAMRSPHEVHWVSSNPARLRDDFEMYLHHQEEPFEDISSYAEFCIAREASHRGVKVLLNGLGGDEVFAGYPAFFGPLVLDALRSGDLGSVLALLRVAPQVLGRNGFASRTIPLAAAVYHALPSRLRNLVTALRTARAQRLSISLRGRAGRDAWSKWHLHDGAGATNAALRGAVESWCIPRYLAHSDRMGLAHGVENRVPLLDEGVIRAAYGVPPSQRLGAAGLKASLRRAVGDILPPLVRDRAWKLGFHVPLEPYVDALEEPLREGSKLTRRSLGEGPSWETLQTPSRWKWGVLGGYLSWVSKQPILRADG